MMMHPNQDQQSSRKGFSPPVMVALLAAPAVLLGLILLYLVLDEGPDHPRHVPDEILRDSEAKTP